MELADLEVVKQGSPEQQIRDFYNAGMDTNRIEELGYDPIKARLDDISKISSIQDFIDLQSLMNMEGSHPRQTTYSWVIT